MHIQEHISLAEHTTFKVGGAARFFCRVSDEDELVDAVRFAQEKGSPIFVLGGGSNILVSDKGFPGLVIKMEIKGIEEKGIGDRGQDTGEAKNQNPKGKNELQTTPSALTPAPYTLQPTSVLVTAGAGETWDDLVEWTVARGLYGLENLSAIPGTVGAAPVQNIGAYGAEAAQVIVSVRALDTQTMKFFELSNADCRFAYRDSMFKHDKGRYIITHVAFVLAKDGKVNTAYKDVHDYFAAKKIASPSIEQVRQAVIEIRSAKLPDWKLWGTAGSFFKNPIVSAERFKALKEHYPDLPGYPEPDGRVKASLGWILDKVCDVKDLCMDKACVYEKQALVIVALPGATAEAVVSLSRELMKRVKDATGLEIEGEVEWVN